jgi:hypothetical protein
MSFIVTIILGVLILLLKNSIGNYVKLIKIFGISLISIMIITRTIITINAAFYMFNIPNLVFSLYLIPYTILLIFFIRLSKKQEILPENIEDEKKNLEQQS